MCDTLGKLGQTLSLFAKNSDRSPNEAQIAEFHPAAENLSGMVNCTVKSNMVYRLCNNMVYTFALGSPPSK